MPVTVYPAQHLSEPCRLGDLLRNASPLEVLHRCTYLKLRNGQKNPVEALDKIWTSSFEEEEHVDIYASANGFVHSAIRAYNAHHHLRIRPDDIWIAILSQLSIYVNTHAEALRSVFVSHQGKKELDLGGAYLHGFDQFASKVTEVLARSFKDQTIPPWIMQEFSTTTPTDRIAAGIIMMATFQSYFKYYDACDCGLPSVTLLGERKDWVQLLNAVDRLETFVPKKSEAFYPDTTAQDDPKAQMTKWISLLRSVLSRFIRSFDAPNTIEIIDFWQQIADYRVGGSGADYLSGWLTLFCFWTEDGRCTSPVHKRQAKVGGLSLDSAYYPFVEWEDIPPGWATVPLEICFDEGGGIVHKCRMLAGSVGITPFLAQTREYDRVGWQTGQACSQRSFDGPQDEDGREPSPRGQKFLDRLLSCCQPYHEPGPSEASKPSVLGLERVDRSSPYPIAAKMASLTDDPCPASTGSPVPYSNGEKRPIHDYETGRRHNRVEARPPAYKLDGLQPRIGWWLWEEKVVPEGETVVPRRARLPDGLEYYQSGVGLQKPH